MAITEGPCSAVGGNKEVTCEVTSTMRNHPDRKGVHHDSVGTGWRQAQRSRSFTGPWSFVDLCRLSVVGQEGVSELGEEVESPAAE